MQWQDDGGAWWVQVQYADGKHSRMLGNFPAEVVRVDTADRSRPVSRAGRNVHSCR